MKKIGILGGMGPESTAHTYMKMIEYCQKEYGAKQDADFPPIVIYSCPIPDVVNINNKEVELLENLESGIDLLKNAGCKFAIIPCNSVQSFLPVLSKKLPIISIVEETIEELTKLGIKKVGLLATQTTLSKRIYQQALEKQGIEMILPENQKEVTEVIRKILEGKKEETKEKLYNIINNLKRKGAGAVILACTDLPLIVDKKDFDIAILDTVEILAKAAVKKYYQLIDYRLKSSRSNK
ncbi:MAG: amino acid racemase [Candidatus Micrarchaeota archaeon]